MTMEVRDAAVAWPDQDFELRSVDGGLEFTGYAAVYGSPSEDLGGFRETIAPGAFTRAVNAAANGSADIRMFLNHNSDIVLGSTKARTLRLSEDSRGLLAEATLPDSVWGHPVAEAVRRGDIRSMSFGFTVPKGGDSWSADRKERTLLSVRLYEVSPITGWPAYAATSASVRSLVEAIDWDDEDAIERVLDGLSDERRDKIARYLNAKSPTPLIDADLAARLARLEAKRLAA